MTGVKMWIFKASASHPLHLPSYKFTLQTLAKMQKTGREYFDFIDAPKSCCVGCWLFSVFEI